MLIPLLLGCATVFITMSVQIAAVVYMLQYLFNTVSSAENASFNRRRATYVISLIMTMLFVGHVIQVAIWAILFMRVGEFADFQTAFYHSMVNFASLGYGDIVMSEKWRLLGAIEASTGVLMFGLSAGAMLSIMTRILAQSPLVKEKLSTLNQEDHNH
jgi:hypothetical protein